MLVHQNHFDSASNICMYWSKSSRIMLFNGISALLSLVFGCTTIACANLRSFATFTDSASSSSSFPSSPVIGVLAQPFTHNHHHNHETMLSIIHANHLNRNSNGNSTMEEEIDAQYIAASYIKWLEAGGARSIPIPYDAVDHDLLDDLFEQMHALFLPGGASELPYAVHYLLDKAVASNRAGYFFPVWGTCLGFEFLVGRCNRGLWRRMSVYHCNESRPSTCIEIQRCTGPSHKKMSP